MITFFITKILLFFILIKRWLWIKKNRLSKQEQQQGEEIYQIVMRAIERQHLLKK